MDFPNHLIPRGHMEECLAGCNQQGPTGQNMDFSDPGLVNFH